jgi:hypothetical protein
VKSAQGRRRWLRRNGRVRDVRVDTRGGVPRRGRGVIGLSPLRGKLVAAPNGPVKNLSYSISRRPPWRALRAEPRIESNPRKFAMSAYASNVTEQPRIRLAWVLLGAVAASQLVAFWLLCSHQVRKAQARQEEAVVQQMALSDCLQYIPGSTIASCNARGDNRQHAVVPAGTDRSALAATVPVSFSFR